MRICHCLPCLDLPRIKGREMALACIPVVVVGSQSTTSVCVFVGSNPHRETTKTRMPGKSTDVSISVYCDMENGCHIMGKATGMTQLCCCSHHIRMPHKGAGVPVLLVHSRGQLTRLLLDLSFSKDHTLHQELCYVQMQQPLVVTHQTLGLVRIELPTIMLCLHFGMTQNQFRL